MDQMKLSMLLLLTSLSVVLYPCYGEFCDEGPPGHYCFENLTGWHECVPGPEGMQDKVHYCPENTRCKCFYGPPCGKEIKDPCGAYKLPPKLVGVVTGVYYGKERKCTAGGCRTEEISGMTFVDSTNGRLREDIDQSSIRMSFLVLPTADKKWAQYTISWNVGTCDKDTEGGEFPGPEIPKFFQYQGNETVSGQLMQVWKWQTGGHNRGQPIDITRMFSADNILEGAAVIGRIEVYHFGTEMSKENFNRNITYVIPSYVDKIVGGDSVFDLPKLCQMLI